MDGIIDSFGQEFEQTPEDSKGQDLLACCNSQGCKKSDMTWQLNNNTAEKNPRTTLLGRCQHPCPDEGACYEACNEAMSHHAEPKTNRS